MNLIYKKATIEDINLLTKSRIEVLKAANKLADDVDMAEVETQAQDYYKKALPNGTHTAYLVFDSDRFIGAGGISYYRVMPTYHNVSGNKAYIMNMYVLLRERGYKKASLSVQKENYAYRLYLKVGFGIVDEYAEEYIMVCDL